MSTDYAHPTRLECKRLLETIGVSVVVQNADGMAMLKCRASERSKLLSFNYSETQIHHVLFFFSQVLPLVVQRNRSSSESNSVLTLRYQILRYSVATATDPREALQTLQISEVNIRRSSLSLWRKELTRPSKRLTTD